MIVETRDDVFVMWYNCGIVSRTFANYMRALGVPKDQCVEFTRRQAKLASLSQGNYTLPRFHLCMRHCCFSSLAVQLSKSLFTARRYA